MSAKYGVAKSTIRDWVRLPENMPKCPHCGAIVGDNGRQCVDCYRRSIRTVERPSYEQLLKELDESNYCQVGKKYGVSDNAIRKWKKYYEKEKQC